MPGFTFVGRETQIGIFRELVHRPQGELLLVVGPEGIGKSHLLRRLRREAEGPGRHFVHLANLGFLPDVGLRHYSIISGLAAAQRSQARETDTHATQLLPNPNEFLDNLMMEDRRPPREKLLRVFSAASGHLRGDARLVLLLDLGRATGEEAFPIEFLARGLPQNVKLVIAAREAPPTLLGLEGVTIVADLPPLTEGDVGRLLEFHLPKGAINEDVTALTYKKFGGRAMETDLAAKLAAGMGAPLDAMVKLQADPLELCRELVRQLKDDERALALCLARVPSGVDITSLRALTDLTDSDLRRLLRSDAIRNIVITQRTPRGPQAHLFHEFLADELLAAAPDGSPEARTFHLRAARFFLDTVEREPHNIDALSAHAHHIRLSADKRQFVRDFPRTYKLKHTFRLYHHLADEYTRLLQYCDELGETSISRPVCLANLGRVHQELGQLGEALQCHRQALDLCQEQDDATGAAEQLANLASVCQALGQLDEALEHLQRAIQLDEAASNKAALAADYNNLGILHQQLGQPDQALECHQRALGLHQELRNDVGIANQLASLAAIHRARGDYHAARECYQKAWVIDTRTHATFAQIADLCNLGLVYQELDDMEKAIASYQQAIELDRAIADREAEAAHLRTLAAMFQKLTRHAEAIQHLQRALDLDRSTGNAAGESADLLGLAAAYRAAGELPLARDLLERAAAFCSRHGDADGEAAARRTLENIDRRLRGETVEEEETETEPVLEPAIQREPAGEGLWAGLQLADDARSETVDEAVPAREPAPDEEPILEPSTGAMGPAFAKAPAAASATPEVQSTTLLDLASEVEDVLRGERDAALRRVAELEVELKTYKQLVETLRKLVGQTTPPRRPSRPGA